MHSSSSSTTALMIPRVKRVEDDTNAGIITVLVPMPDRSRVRSWHELTQLAHSKHRRLAVATDRLKVSSLRRWLQHARDHRSLLDDWATAVTVHDRHVKSDALHCWHSAWLTLIRDRSMTAAAEEYARRSALRRAVQHLASYALHHGRARRLQQYAITHRRAHVQLVCFRRLTQLRDLARSLFVRSGTYDLHSSHVLLRRSFRRWQEETVRPLLFPCCSSFILLIALRYPAYSLHSVYRSCARVRANSDYTRLCYDGLRCCRHGATSGSCETKWW